MTGDSPVRVGRQLTKKDAKKMYNTELDKVANQLEDLRGGKKRSGSFKAKRNEKDWVPPQEFQDDFFLEDNGRNDSQSTSRKNQDSRKFTKERDKSSRQRGISYNYNNERFSKNSQHVTNKYQGRQNQKNDGNYDKKFSSYGPGRKNSYQKQNFQSDRQQSAYQEQGNGRNFKEKFQQNKYAGQKYFKDRNQYIDKNQFKDRNQFSDKRQFEDRNQYTDKNQFKDHNQIPDKRQFQDRNQHSNSRQFKNRNQYEDEKQFKHRNQYQEKKHSNRDRNQFGDRKQFKERNQDSDQKSSEERNQNRRESIGSIDNKTANNINLKLKYKQQSNNFSEEEFDDTNQQQQFQKGKDSGSDEEFDLETLPETNIAFKDQDQTSHLNDKVLNLKSWTQEGTNLSSYQMSDEDQGQGQIKKDRRRKEKKEEEDWWTMDVGDALGEQFLDRDFMEEDQSLEEEEDDGGGGMYQQNGRLESVSEAQKLDSFFIQEKDLSMSAARQSLPDSGNGDSEESDKQDGIGSWGELFLKEVQNADIEEEVLDSNLKLMKDWEEDVDSNDEESQSDDQMREMENEIDQYEDEEDQQEQEDLEGYYEWVQNVRYPVRKLRTLPNPPQVTFDRPQIRSYYKWGKIDWDEVEKEVFDMQSQIYQYTKYSDQVMYDRQTVHELQKQLINNYAAKLLAVRIATTDFKRIKRPGVDLLENVKPAERMELVEDVSIDGRAQKVRRHEKNLVLTYEDEVKQVLVRMALEPEWEARFEPNSFGFRPGRSKYDAVLATLFHFRKENTQQYYINARIDFRALDIEQLMYKLDTIPAIEKQIRAWFQKAAIVVPDNMTDQNFRETDFDYNLLGPFLVNVALHGIEWEIKQFGYNLPESPGLADTKAGRAKQINLIRFGNEFVVHHPRREILMKVFNQLQRWLQKRGLTFDENFTHMGNAGQRTAWKGREVPAGLTFCNFVLVQSLRMMQGQKSELRVLIRPSRACAQQHLDEVGRVVKFHYATKAEDLVHALNPRIQEFCKEFSISSLRMPFSYMDFMLYQRLRSWGYRRHNNKGKKWVRAKYFKVINERRRLFGDDGSYQVLYRELQLTRHPHLHHTKSVYDLDWDYWNARLNSHPDVGYQKYEMLKRQGGKCAYCMRPFHIFDVKNMHLRLLVPREEGGTSYELSNLQLIHRHCQYHVLQEMGWERVEYLKDLKKKMDAKRWKRKKKKPIIV